MPGPILPSGLRNIQGVVRWKMGPYTSFGKGIEEDSEGNVIAHLLKADKLDYSAAYGEIDAFSEYESQFEGVYKTADGDPDYNNNMSEISDFFTEVLSEPIYTQISGSVPSPLVVNVKQGPIIVNTYEGFDITLSLVKADGSDGGAITDFTLTDYDSVDMDRLSDGISNILKNNTITINSHPTLEKGDTIFASYAYFHHTDMARDAKDYSVFSSPAGKTSITLTFDLNPTGNLSLLQEVNNVEFVAPDIPIPVGATDYILQIGTPDVQGNINYKVVSTGKLALKTAGSSTVLKFNSRSIKYLKLILLGSALGAYSEVNVATHDSTVYPLDAVSIVPYYVDPTVSDVQSTLLTGEPIRVVETTEVANSNSAIGRLYIPQYNIYDIESRQHYRLSHYDIRYGTEVVYQGMPSSFLETAGYYIQNNVPSIGVAEPYPVTGVIADVYLPMSYDLVSRSSSQGETYFSTAFRNVDASSFELYSIKTGQTSETLLSGGGVDYTLFPNTGAISKVVGLEIGERLLARYKHTVIRNTNTSTDSIYFICAENREATIRYSALKVFPSMYFADYLVNDDSEVYTFDINPVSQSDSMVSNKQLVKLLDGGYVKQTFGRGRRRMSISGERITDEMFAKLEEYEQRTEALGLVTDMLEFKKVSIVPDSLKGQRKKTSALDQEGYTTQWSYSMDIQEL